MLFRSFTNGTLLNNDWCTFLKENNFRINLSLDGPREFHNRYRTTVYGTESFEFVINGLNLLKKFNIKTEYTVGIHDLNVKHPYKMYDFIRKSELTDVTFRPYISHTKAKKESWSIDAYRYGEFLCSIFDMWVRRDIGRIKISIIEDTLKIFCNRTGSLCTFKPTWGHSAVMKADGNIYTCSKYIQPDHQLGDMFNHTITGLMYSRKQIKFGQSKKNNLTKQCKRCEYLRFCNGGCPKDRVATSNTGEKGHNYLCQA